MFLEVVAAGESRVQGHNPSAIWIPRSELISLGLIVSIICVCLLGELFALKRGQSLGLSACLLQISISFWF